MQDLEAKTAKQAAIIYTGISLALALIFLLITFFNGKSYTAVARIGGTIWVFILSMIITMPIVIPYVKKRVMG
ncbi:hypothetical protein [Neomoorella humiferrea]|uniref:Uncharacterized protein n=1 Tax=Neomoorella humiferrea TaxID=676965 RepID=A0A2T0ALL0_9FIRM|nr:hypothetical protein [Moorella humiferrea]PRR69511.1 hypothetical protein MOHU_23150 [Moorella humiferrea]